uniref:putative reverse transcriptase/maturase n=1 Tax=Dixoniella grisea TaxID=35153 RepID=UPI001FCD26B6|nr:putative reverse transcriptase/maturase [Dixoniella grisea]UNJ17215.1 putative reverse transcriptase/maturase [Dixoniella grisea]
MINVIKDTKCDSWFKINWTKSNRIVNNLQRRIFAAKQEGNFRKVRKLQNLLLYSQSNRNLAVQQVSLLNAGTKTSGINKKVCLDPSERMKLLNEISINSLNKWKPMPAKRIYILKSNSTKKPLDIPTIKDRALQTIVKNALEPEWEAVFAGSIYDFRKNRSAHDAIKYIHKVFNSTTKKHWIVNADIKGCFNNLSHKFLIEKISRFPALQLIKHWLKAGYINKYVFHDSKFETTQGGIISPLLANITLHGIEHALNIKRNKTFISTYKCIRYANNCIIACQTKEEAQNVVDKLYSWLKNRNLTLSPEKTKITHISDGFDFLGFNIRIYKNDNRQKLLIQPSKQSIIKFRHSLKSIWKEVRGSNINKVIVKLNPIIKGWANYYRSARVSSKVFSTMDYYIWNRQYRHVKRTHPNKSWQWIREKYWGKLCPDKKDRWVFGDKSTGAYMYKLAWTTIKKGQVMVKVNNSYYDPSFKD